MTPLTARLRVADQQCLHGFLFPPSLKMNPALTSSAHTAGPWIQPESAYPDTGLLIYGFNRHHEPLDHVYNPDTKQIDPVYKRIAIAELDRGS